MSSQKFVNDPKDAVIEMLEGMVATIPHLKRLDGFPEVRLSLLEVLWMIWNLFLLSVDMGIV